jgi:hypothetical protein
MLSQYITTFQGFFTRAFWFGSFLPVALFAFLHLVIAWLAFDTVELREWLAADQSKLTLFPAIFAGLVMISYSLSPMVPVFGLLVEGWAMPSCIQQWLRRERMRATKPIREAVDDAELLLKSYRIIHKCLPDSLEKARAIGKRRQSITDKQQFDRAKKSVEALRKQWADGQIPSEDHAKAAVRELVKALEANDTEHRDQNALILELEKLQDNILDLVFEWKREADHRVHALYTRYCRINYRDPEATRMADARVMTETYSLNVYNVDFSYIWPRLQLVLPEQGSEGQVGSFNDRLIAARSRVDFAVLSLALALTIPLVWIPLIAWHGNSVPLFIGIGIGSPLLAVFFYQLAVESQFEFGELVKAAIDKYRFAVLTDLHQALPPTLTAERELWRSLRVAEQVSALAELFYRHNAPL